MPGPKGDDSRADLTAITRRLERIERLLADPNLFQGRAVAGKKRTLEGTIFCPECSRPYDVQEDLKVRTAAHARFRCECGADLDVTPEGVTVRGA